MNESLASAETVDVVVVGGGPGGSTVATLVAKQGHRVLLLEKERFPRYRIGESLLPSTVHGVCRMLGVSDALHDAGFVVKLGGTLRWGSNPEPWRFNFAVSSRLAGPTAYAYQVERMKFDQILLNNAKACGVDVREQCSVVDVLDDGERVSGVRYEDENGRTHEVTATFVVDASGNESRISQKIGGKRQYSDFFRNLAMFGYFEGGKRMEEPYAGNVLSAAFKDGWFWYIPLGDNLTSVGAVVSRDTPELLRGDREHAFRKLIDGCPMVRDLLSDATRITSGPYGEIRIRKDYSYVHSRFWRPGMMLVGDAACFVDPVFSTGVHLSTYGGLLAARSINSCLAGLVDEQRSFEEFEARYRKEYGLFYEFLIGFYDMNQNEDSYFWQAKKVTNCPVSEFEAFVELVGGVASGEAAIPNGETLRSELSAVSTQLSSAIQGSITHASNDDNLNPLLDSRGLERFLEEGAALQVDAALGNAAHEPPRIPGGLLTAADGMHWMEPDTLKAHAHE
ncbi:tryptophan 7-halogenase [Saccharopolyspora sp. NPDC000995]